MVDDAEALANYIVESNKFKRGSVDHRAYLPGRDGERSVFRTDGLANEDVAALGQTNVAAARNKTLLGWATIFAEIVRRAIPLTVRSDEPPPRHAVIESWPEALEERRKLAMFLASKAETTKCPTD